MSTTAATALPIVGARYILKRGVDRLPDLYVESGACGEVVHASESMIFMKLDAPVKGAEEWNNCIMWPDNNIDSPADEFALDCEILPGQHRPC